MDRPLVRSIPVMTVLGALLLAGGGSVRAGEVWRASYDGPGNGQDFLADVAVDSTGHVFVTGSSVGAGTGEDFATLKYGPRGDLLWAARFDAGGREIPQELTVDRGGNVSIAGGILDDRNDGLLVGLVTVHYDAEGRRRWAVRRPASPDSTYVRVRLALDRAGDLFEAAEEYGPRPEGVVGTVAMILKRHHDDGRVLWELNLPRSSPFDWVAAFAIAEVGSEESIFVLVNSGDISGGPVVHRVLKYDLDGRLAGEFSYASEFSLPAAAQAMDAEGNVFITGGMGTVKLDTRGKELWRVPPPKEGQLIGLAVDSGEPLVATLQRNGQLRVERFDRDGGRLWSVGIPGGGYALQLTADPAGNLHVGNGLTVAKLDRGGNLLWSAARGDGCGGQKFDVDAAGNVFVGLTLDTDLHTFGLDPAGKETWSAVYSGPGGGLEFAHLQAIDPAGDILVAGTSEVERGVFEVVAMKLDSSGRRVWATRIRGPDGTFTHPFGLALDRGGNAFVAGSASVSHFLAKLDRSGEKLWMEWIPGDGRALAVDGEGRAALVGWDGLDGGRTLTSHFDSDGRRLWRVPHPSDCGASAVVAFDPRGNIVVVSALVALRYDGEGNRLSETSLPGGEELFSWRTSSALRFDPAGETRIDRIVLQCSTGGGQSSGRLETLRLGLDGDFISNVLSGEFTYAYHTAIAYDAAGNVYAFGGHCPEPMDDDDCEDVAIISIAKLAPSGELLWRSEFPSTLRGSPAALTVAPSGQAYAVLHSGGDSYTAEFDPEGKSRWLLRQERFWARAVGLDPAGDLVLSGDSHFDIATLKLDLPPAEPPFKRGDVDSNGTEDLSDPIALLNRLFLGGEAPECEKAADADDDGAVQLNDAVYLLNHLFLGGPPPAEPARGCGLDPTEDGLGCYGQASCRT